MLKTQGDRKQGGVGSLKTLLRPTNHRMATRVNPHVEGKKSAAGKTNACFCLALLQPELIRESHHRCLAEMIKFEIEESLEDLKQRPFHNSASPLATTGHSYPLT
jgi:hypothetical protein